MPTFARRPSTMSSSFPGEYSEEFQGWTAKTANVGAAIRQIPYSTNIFILEDKIQKPGDYLL